MLSPFVPILMWTAATTAALGGHQAPLQAPASQRSSQVSIIPPLGFGTSGLNKSDISEVVSAALHAGYRHLDCATVYGNQKEVGKGIAHGLESSNLSRSDIWVTSKLWNDYHDPSLVEEAITQTLDDLGLAYIDLWLMHYPVGSAPDTGRLQLDYLPTWHAMEKVHKSGRVRNIGVSNFSPAQLKDIIKKSDTKPSHHQFELHPYLPQSEWIQYQQKLGISITAYSPFANTNPAYNPGEDNPPFLLTNTVIKEIAAKRQCTVAQVALAWGMSRGTSEISKSSHVKHITENFAASECYLDQKDLKRIDRISEKHLKRFNNPSESWGIRLFDGLEDS